MALEFTNDAIQETHTALMNGGTLTSTGITASHNGLTGYVSNCIQWTQPYTYWSGYPVYITTDKTGKAIDILKALQADKTIECKSVPRFLELVEKIVRIL